MQVKVKFILVILSQEILILLICLFYVLLVEFSEFVPFYYFLWALIIRVKCILTAWVSNVFSFDQFLFTNEILAVDPVILEFLLKDVSITGIIEIHP